MHKYRSVNSKLTTSKFTSTTMKKLTFLTFSTLLIWTTVAQLKVANYSFGKPGTDKYEHLDFWTKDGKRTEINYSYGKNRKEVKLQSVAKDKLNGSACCKIKFANNYLLYIIPKGHRLQVTDASGKYNKTFFGSMKDP